MKYYNSHTHIFTMSNAPTRFLDLYMPKFATTAINTITNTSFGEKAIEWILRHIPWKDGKRYASFLQIGKSKNQFEVFRDLLEQYTKTDPDMKFAALTLNMEHLGVGDSTSGFVGQIEEILDVKKQYPEQLLVFFSIDPRWPTDGTPLKTKVQSYFENKISVNAISKVSPFAGIKLYPSAGFYCFDDRLLDTFAWVEEKGIPVIAHCNYMGGIYINDRNYTNAVLQQNMAAYPIPQSFPLPKSISNQEACSYFLEPNSYKILLSKYPKLKLCFAHYGGDNHILIAHGMKPETPICSVVQKNWCSQIMDLMEQYDNLYTDISYAIHNKDIHDCIFFDMDAVLYPPNDELPDSFATLPNRKFTERILFGTDFFMTEREMPENQDYTTFKQKALNVKLRNGNNAWDQIASINTSKFLENNLDK